MHKLQCHSAVGSFFYQEGLRRRAQGYFKVALDPNVTAIADSNSWHELENMRFEDEAVRWRLTEFLVSF